MKQTPFAIANCRLCATPLPDTPVSTLANVPQGVQFFPPTPEVDPDTGQPMHIFQCVRCNLVQTRTAPVVYQSGTTSATSYSQSMMQFRREQVVDFVDAYGLKGKTILDVGCGDGHLLGHIQAAGAEGVGIDASEAALAIAKGKGYTVHYGYVTRDFAIPDGPFDAFISHDVIEHIPDIEDFVLGIRQNLQDGAVGIIETPNFDHTLNQHRFYDFILDHLSYFTATTLTLALQLNGFDVLEVSTSRNDENLVAVVQKRPTTTRFDEMRTMQEQTLKTLADFFAQHQAKQQTIAVWGASLHTLTLSTLTSFDGVQYVIDSANYKQNHVTPVSHLPIVAPQTLFNEPVDSVLVIAPRYAGEIIEKLRDEFAFKGNIATLDGSEITMIQETIS